MAHKFLSGDITQLFWYRPQWQAESFCLKEQMTKVDPTLFCSTFRCNAFLCSFWKHTFGSGVLVAKLRFCNHLHTEWFSHMVLRTRFAEFHPAASSGSYFCVLLQFVRGGFRLSVVFIDFVPTCIIQEVSKDRKSTLSLSLPHSNYCASFNCFLWAILESDMGSYVDETAENLFGCWSLHVLSVPCI